MNYFQGLNINLRKLFPRFNSIFFWNFCWLLPFRIEYTFITNIHPNLHPQTSLIDNNVIFLEILASVVIVHCGHWPYNDDCARRSVRCARIPSGQREEESDVSPSSVSTCLTSGAGWPDPFTFKEIIHGTVLLVTPDCDINKVSHIQVIRKSG